MHIVFLQMGGPGSIRHGTTGPGTISPTGQVSPAAAATAAPRCARPPPRRSSVVPCVPGRASPVSQGCDPSMARLIRLCRARGWANGPVLRAGPVGTAHLATSTPSPNTSSFSRQRRLLSSATPTPLLLRHQLHQRHISSTAPPAATRSSSPVPLLLPLRRAPRTSTTHAGHRRPAAPSPPTASPTCHQDLWSGSLVNPILIR